MKIIEVFIVLSGCAGLFLSPVEPSFANFSFKNNYSIQNSNKRLQSKKIEGNGTANLDNDLELKSQENKKIKNNIDIDGSDEFETKRRIVEGENSSFFLETQDGQTRDIKDKLKENSNDLAQVNETNETAVTTLSYADNNEENDAYSNASEVLGVEQIDEGYYGLNIWWWATINQKTGWWWSTYLDKDFYSYDVVMNGNLTIDLTNIPTGCDYDLKLFCMSNNSTSNYDTGIYEVSSSTKGGNSSEHINLSVIPGTYYAEVYSYKGYSDESPYEISFSIVDKLSYEAGHVSISDSQDEGALGLVWLSDFNPFGLKLNTLTTDESKYYYGNYDSYAMARHLADKYNANSGKSITYETLYVWDKSLRVAIFAVANSILNSLDAYDEWQANTQNILHITFSNTDLVLTVADVVVSIVGLIPVVREAATIAGIAVTSVSTLVTVVEYVYDHFAPAPFNETKEDIREYLINLKSAMEVGNGTSNTEVIAMQFRYRFGDEFNWGTKRFLDYHQFYRNNDTNIYNDEVVDFYNPNSPINGSIHKLTSLSDLSKYM